MKAWHFVNNTLRDGRPVPADGEKLIYPDKPRICEKGLHASLRPWDALTYAPGDTLCLVECAGDVIHQSDKLVCTERTILARMGSAPLLRHFAKQQALSVIHLWQTEPDQVVLDYLMGDNTARPAARDAARAAWAMWSVRDAAARSAAWATWSVRDAAAAGAGEVFDALVTESFVDFLTPGDFAAHGGLA
jgi:hypothetical protein